MAVRPSRKPTLQPGRDSRPVTRPLSQFSWVQVYALVPFTLICVYYLIIFWVGQDLAFAVGKTLNNVGTAQTPTQLTARIAFLVVFISLLVLLVLHLARGIVALLTQADDDAPEAAAGVPLSREESPAVFETVAEVGARIGAPLPDEIRVTPVPECYAAEVRWFAVRTRRRLVLVLGLPHLAVLSVGELKVLLAHELAHFSGDTRLIVFTYRFLNTLRQTVDSARARWRRYIDPCYWYTWTYYYLMFLLTGPVIRQQELQADRASAAFYGGGLAARTLLKEWLIIQQFDAAMATFPGSAKQDNATLFSWFDQSHRVFSDDGLNYLEQRLAELESPSIWDSHPAMKARLDAVRKFEDAEDEDPRPARALIPDYKNLEMDLHRQAMLEMASTVTFPGVEDDVA